MVLVGGAGAGEGRALDSHVIPKPSQGAEARTSRGERMEIKCSIAGSVDVTGVSQLHPLAAVSLRDTLRWQNAVKYPCAKSFN